MTPTPPVVLVLENDDLNREFLVDLLGLWSYTVHGFGRPEEAMSAVKHGGLQPDLVMTDLHLDDTLSGVDFVRQLRKHDGFASVPAIIVTGDSSLNLLREGLMIASVALKPIRPEKLRTQIAQHLRQSNTG